MGLPAGTPPSPAGRGGRWHAPCSGQRPCCAASPRGCAACCPHGRAGAATPTTTTTTRTKRRPSWCRWSKASRRCAAACASGRTPAPRPSWGTCGPTPAAPATSRRTRRGGAWRRAARLAGRRLEGRLRELGRRGGPAPASERLADLFQGLEIYNGVVRGLAEELGPEAEAPGAFTVGGVLRLLAAERGRAVARRLRPLLWPQSGDIRDGRVCWEDVVLPWPPRHDAAERGTGVGTEPSGTEVPPALAAELQALCQEDEELMGQVFGALVASADSLWQPVLSESPEAPGLRPGSAGGWKAVRWLDAARGPVAATLSARYRLLLWEAVGAALGDSPGTPPATPSATVSAAWELSRALAVVRVPAECREELGQLCLQLLCRSVLCSWDTDFTRALGSGLSDKCLETPGGSPGPGCSRTAQQLRCLFPALALALRCLRLLPARPHAPPGGLCLRLQVLGRCLAVVAAAHAWLTGRAGRYLAAWALPQFLLLTQGDLQVLKAEAEQLVLQASRTFPEPGDIPGDSPPEPLPSPPGSPWELQLCRQIRDVANSIQLFSGDVVWMFSTSCKRLSAEIFDQTMPLGRHWRLGPRAELPSSPSAYAAAAVQAVLGQVLQGAQALPHDAQVPTLARVTTAFLEAWMDHILTRRIKFSASISVVATAWWQCQGLLPGVCAHAVPVPACRVPCSCGGTSRRRGSWCAPRAPGWPPRHGGPCARSASSGTRTRPCGACCSSRGGRGQPPGHGAASGAAAQTKAPTPWKHPWSLSLAWTLWRGRARCRGRPRWLRRPMARPGPSPRSRAASSSGCPCGCTEPAAGACRGCRASGTAPRADPQ
ncbi:coiled-coil domain-containing protein 142 isoform X3 [Passer montanus]|uniref:coiled-coil domain-containing protein 142 isoform X3 n=1 Tax=Passer montanus TaxID=9160 RepID=UPI00195FE4C4|nr:coiled-coil domain-containing protein 142 isoform X3 [Passer montanus]